MEYPDNTDVIALLCHRPSGILRMLDDECQFPKVSGSIILYYIILYYIILYYIILYYIILYYIILYYIILYYIILYYNNIYYVAKYYHALYDDMLHDYRFISISILRQCIIAL